MKMKKIGALLMAGVLCLSVLAGCSGGGSKESQQPSSNPGTSSQAPETQKPAEKAHPTLNLRITTDIHEAWQAKPAGDHRQRGVLHVRADLRGPGSLQGLQV